MSVAWRVLTAALHRSLLVVVTLGLVMTATTATTARAFGELPTSAQDLPQPGFELRPGTSVDALPLQSQRTIVDVAGVVARIRLEQVWVNRGTVPIEATYVFPTSTRAAVHDLRIRIGTDRELTAEIRAKEMAKKIFDAARDEGQTAGLLEQQRPNAVTMHLTNVMPGEQITVFVEASELIRPIDGIYELVLPQTLGPRFAGNATTVDDGFVDNGFIKGKASTVDTAIDVTIRSPIGVRGIGSPTHAVAPRFTGANEGRVIVHSSADDVVADRELVLRWRLAADTVQTGVLLFRDKETDEHFFMLLGEAPAEVSAAAAPPREVVFVVDVSGSMSGFPLQTAKALVRELTTELRPTDTFNIVFFAGGSDVLSPSGSLPATAANLRLGHAMIDAMQGGGGTMLLEALKTAFNLGESSGSGSSPSGGGQEGAADGARGESGERDGIRRARAIVVVTDGMISAERAAFTLVKDRIGDATLFAFGVHGSVNRHLIEGLAAAGRTEPFVVHDASMTERAVDHFRTVAARPALTNVTVAFDGFKATDLEPSTPTDLYPGRPLVVLGRFTGPSSGHVTVTGTGVGGVAYNNVIAVEDNLERAEHAPLRQLWARERVARLADRDAPDDTALAEVERLGLRYRLLTERTSFVVVDPKRRNRSGELAAVQQPSVLPKDMSSSFALAGLSGASLGTGYGSGGLGSRGTGAGGGGFGSGVGRGSGIGIGTLGAGGGDIGLSTRTPPRVKNGAVVVQGSLDKAVITRVIRAHEAQVRYCYERRLVTTPGLAGKVSLRFTIAADGRVTAVTVDHDSVKDAALNACLVGRAKTWRFPSHPGAAVVVTWPWLFQPAP